MKILHVVVSVDPAQGGLPAVALRLAAAQAVAGHEVSLTAHDNRTRREAIEKSMGAVPHIDRVHRELLDDRVRAGTFISKDASSRLRASIAQADVVHLHGLWEPLIRDAALMASRLGKPYVLTPHGMLDPWSLQQRWFKKKVAMALLFRRILNRAAFLHVLNEDESRLLEPLRLRSTQVIIPNGVFMEEINPLPPKGRFRETRPELGQDPYVLFLSRLHHKKGLDHLAPAFAHALKTAPKLRLVVAGPDEGAQAEFERAIQRLGVADRTHVVGSIWGRDKYAAIVDAACFCLPSRQEGFSIAITESLACGIPVVVSEHCHFPEVALSGAGEIVPLEPVQIGDAIARVVSSEASREEMGRRGSELVKTRFVWPVIAQRLIDVYQRAVERPR